MPKGISLHIGLNLVDPVHYGGWDGRLTACEFDAIDMEKLAKARGFTTQKLLTAAGTAAAVQAAISQAAKELSAGDIFFITYSGHGGQVPDRNNEKEEADRMDETWCLYDREMIDDELHSLYARFKAGVRILVFSDSCHSGTVAKAVIPRPASDGQTNKPRRNRAMPVSVRQDTYRRHRALYDKIQKTVPPAETVKVKASVLLISGCQDNQTSADGDRNGLFTEKLRKVWANGKFKGGHVLFHSKIKALMPPDQTPNFFRTGATNAAFEEQRPFTI